VKKLRPRIDTWWLAWFLIGVAFYLVVSLGW
jgi:hypothetical protein